VKKMSEEVKGKRNKADKKAKQKKEMIIGAVMIAIAIFGTYGTFAILKAVYKTDTPLVVVTSGSMEPVISRGDLLVIEYRDPADIQTGTIEDLKGDIILYDSHGVWSNPIPEPVVHRVVGKYFNETDKKYYFITKGDANADTDPPDLGNRIEIPVPEDKVIGVVVRIIPEIGKVKLFLDDTGSTVPLIIILGGLLVISIIWDITHPEEEEEEDTPSPKLKKKRVEISEKKDEEIEQPEPKIDMGL
jgi:signal peptidase